MMSRVMKIDNAHISCHYLSTYGSCFCFQLTCRNLIDLWTHAESFTFPSHRWCSISTPSRFCVHIIMVTSSTHHWFCAAYLVRWLFQPRKQFRLSWWHTVVKKETWGQQSITYQIWWHCTHLIHLKEYLIKLTEVKIWSRKTIIPTPASQATTTKNRHNQKRVFKRVYAMDMIIIECLFWNGHALKHCTITYWELAVKWYAMPVATHNDHTRLMNFSATITLPIVFSLTDMLILCTYQLLSLPPRTRA